MRVLRGLVEIASLAAALFLIMPYIPSHEGYVHQFGKEQVMAIVLFGVSRALRWQKVWWIAVLETAVFGYLAWALQMSYNLL